MAKTFTTENGKVEVVIKEGAFQDSMRLKNAVLAITGNERYDIRFLDVAPEVYAALWPCLMQCTYDLEKITPKTFESPTAREDYYEVINACVEENIRPFFKGLGSAFSLFNPLPASTNTQNSK